MSASVEASEGPTSTLLPSVTRVAEASRLELGPVSIVLATLLVFILSLLTVGSNSIILAAFYRYKRLRTASNCLLVSLAVSDFAVGVFMPFGTYLELADAGPGGPSSSLCVVPYCVLIALCSVSVLVTVAIAVDRLTSLAQPLRYKNIITHSSIEKYIAVFWIYATIVGMSPLIYAKIVGVGQAYGGSCRFNGVIMPPVRVFLFLAVWAPSALILLGCYMYVYLVARAHARAIYTVELSFRNQTQTLALPRYGQTLAVTVGAFFILWLPFQTCMLLDIFCGTNILSDLTIWLGLPILAHSGTNPWIYAFHHGEMRIAAGKIAEDLVALFGVTPSRYGCSPTRRGSNTNLELAEVNNSCNEERRPPVEDCFAAKHHQPHQQSIVCSEEEEGEGEGEEEGEDIQHLAKMLEPRYVVDRSHLIDSNHNIDKIKSLKYLLDPTFSKIRHLRRLNKPVAGKSHESRFVSYQNLKTEATMHAVNSASEPTLNAESPPSLSAEGACPQQRCRPCGAGLASALSDSNIGLQARSRDRRSFGWARARLRLAGKNYCSDLPSPTSCASLPTPDPRCSLGKPRQLMSITPNRLASLYLQPPILEPSRLADALQEEDSSSSSSSSNNIIRSPSRHSEPVIPSVLLDIDEDSSEQQQQQQQQLNGWPEKELSDLLLRCSESSSRFADSIFPEHDSTRFSSRRPSDSKWSESSRSQEVLSNVPAEQPRFPSSYSVNNFQSRNSGSDLNDLTSSCLEPFMCSDALSSSLRESFFSAASVPDSEDIFTSFETDEPCQLLSPPGKTLHSRSTSRSSANLVRSRLQDVMRLELQSKSTESMFREREQTERLCAIFKLEPSIHGSRPRLRAVACKEASQLAPLATPTPTDLCTPTFDITVVADIKAETGLGVRV